MAKKKLDKNIIAEQIKALIDAGDYEGAQALISGEVQNRPPSTQPKKRGRPKKIVAPPPEPFSQRETPRPPSSPANFSNGSSSGFSGCIAPARRVDAPRTGGTIEKDGKTYTVSVKVPFTPPKKVNFKEDKTIAKDVDKEGNPLHYPPRPEPREPAEQIDYICHLCSRVEYLYPGQGPDSDMLYTCTVCMKRNKPR